MKITSIKLDNIGIIAGTLCMIHCILTPFLFIAKACSTVCCSDTPVWWQLVDYAFLIISFYAIYFITKKSTLSWIKISFWTSWVFLFLTLINHTFMIIPLSKYIMYIPASAIIFLHFYNLRFCKCSEESCCVDLGKGFKNQ